MRQGIVAALRDPKGGSGKDFWLKLKCGNGEDRRTFANICSRLIPVEIRGDIDAALTVQVVTLVNADEREVPSHGTCIPGESERIPTTPPTNEVKTPDVEDA